MPSRYPEPYGLVAMEAAWSGLPVIVPETALLSKDLVAAGAGIAIDPRDTPAFARAIGMLWADDALVRRMSEAAFSQTGMLALTVPDWIARLEQHHRDLLRPDLAQQAAAVPAIA
jgi:glycosyltransferase involved in cell wall biosynthesis